MTKKNVLIPDDYNDLLYRVTYHALGKVAPYIPRSISPNQITLMAFTSAIIACVLLFEVQTPAAFLYWVLFNFIWYLLDALDGIHARFTDQTSEFGGFLDHFLDNIFFVVMFTVFAVKFDLAHTLYIYAIILRVTAALTVFLVQAHTQRLYLGSVSGGLELILFSSVMILSYFFPDFDPSQHTTSQHLLYLIHALYLEQGMFMKLSLLVYIIGVPINMVFQIKFVREHFA